MVEIVEMVEPLGTAVVVTTTVASSVAGWPLWLRAETKTVRYVTGR